MSGFAGIIGPDGAALDPQLVEMLAAAVAYCGPDRQDSWRQGPVGLVHALLRTTFEDCGDRQPLSFDGEVHLVADARVDGRSELLGRLRGAGREVRDDAPDSELILHAYHAWGEACVERLLGDYAFAVWDARERKLFCARDHFGVTPFYHASIGEWFVFGNTIEALLVHPKLDRALNRATIGDYLLFGHSNDPQAGFYRHIHRLAPAHRLSYRNRVLRIGRYWHPPDPFPKVAREADRDAGARFAHAMGEAVKDRLRCARVASTISGGMDSTTVTGLAARHAPAGTHVAAYSSGSDFLLPDSERHFAHRCAHHFGIPFNSFSAESTLLDTAGGNYWRYASEPRFWMRRLPNEALLHGVVAGGTRVLLTGMGGDALAAGGSAHWRELIERGRFARLAQQVWQYIRFHRRRPPVLGALRRRWLPIKPPPLPSPVTAAFAAEQMLDAKWREAYCADAISDPRRSMTGSPFWSELLCGFDPESLRLPLKVRHPFFDVRLLEEAMRLPPSPWLFNKAILRRIGAGLLPQEILTRPKTPFAGSLYWEAARLGYETWLEDFGQADELDDFVARSRLPTSAAEVERLGQQRFLHAVMYPASLAAWLRMVKTGPAAAERSARQRAVPADVRVKDMLN